jgi:hypothetical protein
VIHYQLVCKSDHAFDGWFHNSALFDRQVEAGLVTCPVCGIDHVTRGLMAPAVRTGAKGGQLDQSRSQPRIPDAIRAELQNLRARIERNCENMGDRFADEAIKMHHGEVEERAIYGYTTDDDCGALADAGVEVMAIPWLKPADG